VTENDIKEALSRHYFGAIASRGGFCCNTPKDFGVDIHVTRPIPDEREGGVRLLETGEQVHIQLKATCERQVIRDGNLIRYDLEAKSYNDLVRRRGSMIPLYLVLLVLPDDTKEWLSVNADDLLLRRHAYWWITDKDAVPTGNHRTVRIEIPAENALTLDFLPNRFAEIVR
jgi:hypothetical protein